MDEWKNFLENGDPESKYLHMSPFKTLKFLETFFRKFTIAENNEDYKDKVKKQEISLQPVVSLTPIESHSLSLLITNYGYILSSSFLYNSTRPIFLDI